MAKKPTLRLVQSFKDYPKSVTEIKSAKTNKASDCLPRDVLIETLRDIDSGALKTKHLIVVWANEVDGGLVVKFNQAGTAGLASLGMMHEAMMKMGS